MNTQYSGAMRREEFDRLMGYYNASRVERTHKPTKVGRRHAKGMAKGIGLVCDNSYIKSLSVEKYVPVTYRNDMLVAKYPQRAD